MCDLDCYIVKLDVLSMVSRWSCYMFKITYITHIFLLLFISLVKSIEWLLCVITHIICFTFVQQMLCVITHITCITLVYWLLCIIVYISCNTSIQWLLCVIVHISYITFVQQMLCYCSYFLYNLYPVSCVLLLTSSFSSVVSS